jgi:NADPH:quinone reductase-like Zn-dependent oxidoreductase
VTRAAENGRELVHYGSAAMKAAYIEAYGPLEEAVRVGERPAPRAGTHDVLIEVHAAGINPIDWKIAEGHAEAWIPLVLPVVLGNEAAGVVTAVGSGVTRFKPGDEVYVRVDGLRAGAYAELLAVDEKLAALKPRSVDFIAAAAVPLAGLTAWQILTEQLKLQRGQTVLVHAGSGGVGSFAIQFAKHLGARVVTTAGPQGVELAKSLGADEVVDYTSRRFEDAVKNADAVFDTIGGQTQVRSLAVLKRGGVLASIVGLAVTPEAAAAAGVQLKAAFMRPDGTQLAEIARLIDAGAVKPVVHCAFTLDEAKLALVASRAGHAKGKLVLQVK